MPLIAEDCSGSRRGQPRSALLLIQLILLCLTTSLCSAPALASAQEVALEQSAPQEQIREEILDYICPMECDDLRFDEPGQCPICGMDIVPNRVRRITAEDLPLFAALEDGGFFDADLLLGEAEIIAERPDRALMPGVPNWLFYITAGLLVLITCSILFVADVPKKNMTRTWRRWDYPRFELTKSRFIKNLITWPGFQPLIQLPVIILFLFVIIAGLIGSQDPSRNIAPVLTWNIWWMGLIFFAFLAGEIWCTVCPWMALPDWLKRLSAKLPRRSRPLGLEKRWPKKLRNLYPAIAAFFLLSWLELAADAPFRPALTALMGLTMVGLAATTLFIFERKGFCRFLCPVGRVTGAYGTTGMLEIRRRDSQICKSCKTKDCFHGNERGLPCPTHEFMGAMNENSYCTMCTECLKSCPHDNIALNIRTPLADLMGPHRRRLDEAWLILSIFIVTIFHGLAMIPLWTRQVLPSLRESAEEFLGKDPGYLLTFSAAMIIFCALATLLYVAICQIARKASGNQLYTLKDFFIAFAAPLLPVALAYHLAHNALHIFYEGTKMVRLISDPFGWGWDLFGTARSPLSMLVPLEYLWASQVVMVILGNMAAVLLVNRAVHRMFGNRRQAARATIPLIIFVALLSVAAMWLLAQPMEMRTA